MRIGVDYRLATRHFGGMAVYLKDLINSLKIVDINNNYILFDDAPSTGPGFKKQIWTIGWEHVWVQLCLPYLFWKQKINLGYFPNPPVSLFLNIPIVLTIPDVSFMYDSTFPKWIKWYLWIVYFLSAHKAQVITTLSNNSKTDIARFFKINLNKIKVTPLAAANGIVCQKLKENLKRNYIITVPGTLIPRKNVIETILAFKKLPKHLTASFQVLIVGNAQGDDFEKLKDFVGKNNLTNKIIFAGRVSDQELSKLYSMSRLFVCTSLYEGFGLSILAAMKCGVPVISYSNSSLSEVTGNAGILVKNVEELSQAMKKVLENKKLQKELIKKGFERESTFNWNETANYFLNSLPKNVN